MCERGAPPSALPLIIAQAPRSGRRRTRCKIEGVTWRPAVSELATLFLRLGTTAFGGPAAHIAMMRDEVVERRRWLTTSEFLDLLAATNLIPGPNSTEMAIHIGYRRCGWRGLLVAGISFILPASCIVAGLAWAYAHYGRTPQVAWLMYGISPLIIAIILDAIWKLGSMVLKGILPALLGLAVVALSLAGVNELALLGAGGLAMLVGRFARTAVVTGSIAALLTTGGAAASATMASAATAVPVTLSRLVLFFVKVGSILFGSGYVLLAFLRADLAERWGWLTDQQLLDAIAIGQVTPGPVFTTATFIGYLLAGWVGAALATAGIFAPGFIFVAVTQPLLPRLRSSPVAGALLDGVIVASLGLMAAVTWHLARAAIVDVPTAALAIGGAGVLFAFRPNSTWLILAGAAAGWILRGA